MTSADQVLAAISRLGYRHQPDFNRPGGLGLTTCPRCSDRTGLLNLLLTQHPDGHVTARCLNDEPDENGEPTAPCDYTVIALLVIAGAAPTELDLVRRRRTLRQVAEYLESRDPNHQAETFWDTIAGRSAA